MDSTIKSRIRIYYTKPKLEMPIYLAIIGSASLGLKGLYNATSLDSSSAVKLNPETINSFDRHVAYYNPANFAQAQHISDVLLTLFVASPSILLLDKKIRNDWQDFITVFLSAHAADNIFYFSTVASVRRPRPLTYNPNVKLDDKIGSDKTNSFFSGHVTWVTTSTFFIAKVYSDYHDIKGLKRVLMFVGASVPPAVVGYYRMEAGKHFPTDIITGFVVGAASGILAPVLHKRKKDAARISLYPFSKLGANGISLSYRLK